MEPSEESSGLSTLHTSSDSGSEETKAGMSEQARRRAPILERIDVSSGASGSLTQGGWHREAQSEPQLQSRLDRPACTMCENIWDSLQCKICDSSEDCYVIFLGPFWNDVLVPGLHNLASGDDNSIKVCKRCTERLRSICEWHMRKIWQTADVSGKQLDKMHVLILAQLRQQCAIFLKHS
jgi:hypothetical protein